MWAFCIFGWRFSVCNVWEIDTQHWLWNRKISDFSKKATLHVIVLGSPMYDQYLVLWLTSHIFITACVDITDTKKIPYTKQQNICLNSKLYLGMSWGAQDWSFCFHRYPSSLLVATVLTAETLCHILLRICATLRKKLQK